MGTAHRKFIIAVAHILCIGCSFVPGAQNQNKPAGKVLSVAELQASLKKEGVPLPGADSALQPPESKSVRSAASTAANEPGVRGPFEAFHAQVAPLLPLRSRAETLTARREQCVTTGLDGTQSECEGGDPGNPEPPAESDCPRVCATACASANAVATASAFAHASAYACAFAEAWACVFTGIPPFGRVCAWARSEACTFAFMTAFASTWVEVNDQECRQVCSDGTTTTFRGPAPSATEASQ